LPSFEDPTYGTLAGDELLFLARSHWGRVNSAGLPIDPPLPDVPVLRANLDDAVNVVVGEKILEQIRQGGAPQG
ncbi:MAG: hypothetical protein RQ729_13145, partial [Wenzhouxiangellaceae bacterium]|nr:hypothetical protein [Wenzhouxiangellaceae bacterium]